MSRYLLLLPVSPEVLQNKRTQNIQSHLQDERLTGNSPVGTLGETSVVSAPEASETLALCSGVRLQHEVEPQRSDPADLRQGGDGEAVGRAGLPRLRLALPAEPPSPVAGERRGVVRPAGTRPEAPRHVGHVGARARTVSRRPGGFNGFASPCALQMLPERPRLRLDRSSEHLRLPGLLRGMLGERSPAQVQGTAELPFQRLGPETPSSCRLTSPLPSLTCPTYLQYPRWSGRGATCVLQLKGHITPVRTLAFSPDGLALASGGVGGLMNIWSLRVRRSQDTRHRLEATQLVHSGCVCVCVCVCVCPTGRLRAPVSGSRFWCDPEHCLDPRCGRRRLLQQVQGTSSFSSTLFYLFLATIKSIFICSSPQ